jgi:pSer/pThr/pTyr-binding forkhead associated (FHA) protein
VELSICVRSEETGARNTAKCNLNPSVTLGRGPESPVPLDETGISREHLRLHIDGNALFVTDLSSNGTWLKGQRLTRGEPHPVKSAEAIRIPGFEIQIESPPDLALDSKQAIPPAPEITARPVGADGPLEAVLAFGASLSKIDRFLIVLAVATLVLVILYLNS